MNPFLEFGGSGVLLGLTAGISPGPLLALVITQTIRFNRKEGFKVAAAPVITDVPIVLIALLVVSKLSSFDIAAGIISVLGSVFIFYLAWDTHKSAGKTTGMGGIKAHSFRKGILVNFLSPHPYLFWFLVGAPIVTSASNVNPWASMVFIGGFYILLIGSKMVIAILAEKSKKILLNRYYVYTLRILAIILAGFALKLLFDGIKLLKGAI